VQNIWQQSPAAKISKESTGWGIFFFGGEAVRSMGFPNDMGGGRMGSWPIS